MISKIFGHVAVGSDRSVLSLIRNDDINAVIQENAILPSARSYVDSLQPGDLYYELDENPYVYKSVDLTLRFKAGTSLEETGAELAKGFSVRDGFDEFVGDVHQTMQNFINASGYEETRGGFMVSLPQSPGCFHRDDATDLRGFKTYRSRGPFGARNGALQAPADGENFYGTFNEISKTHAEDLIQMPEGAMGIWKGDVHEHPFLHSLYSVAPGEFRLTMMMEPTKNSYYKKIEELGLRRGYQAPVDP